MSTEPGGKAVADGMVEQSRDLLRAAAAKERQLEMLDPITPEEMALAQAELGPRAGNITVLQHARATRRGRPKGARNRRSDDFAKYVGAFGQDPAITLMQIQSTPAEVLTERSRSLDPEKRRMTYGEAQALRVRCAEALLPYMHSKKPVAVDVGVSGDFNLIIPGLNVSEADAAEAAAGTFVLGEWSEVDGEGGA